MANVHALPVLRRGHLLCGQPPLERALRPLLWQTSTEGDDVSRRGELPGPFEFLALREDEQRFIAGVLHAVRLGRLIAVRELADAEGTRVRVFVTRNATLTEEELDAVLEDVRAQADDALAREPGKLLAKLEQPTGRLRLALARVGITEDALTRSLVEALNAGELDAVLASADVLELFRRLRVLLAERLGRLERLGGNGDCG